MGFQACDVVSLEKDLPTFRAVGARYDIEQGCLASSVWPNQADNLTCVDLDINPVERDQTTKKFRDPLEFEKGSLAVFIRLHMKRSKLIQGLINLYSS